MKTIKGGSIVKKSLIAILAISTVLAIGACTKNTKSESKESGSTSMTSKKEQSTEQSSGKIEQKKSLFTAVLLEDAKKNETVDQSIRLVLTKVEAIEDPESILNMMKNDGVILNVSEGQLANGLKEEDLKSGDKIQFTLVDLPAMTMSIPPQVAGNSVLKVEKI